MRIPVLWHYIDFLVCFIFSNRLTNCSSRDSTSLLVLADALNAYPVIVKNIASPLEQQIVLSDKEYKYKNWCGAYSPIADSALIVTRSGTVKLANCSPGLRSWGAVEIGKRLSVSRGCSVGFSSDGYRAVALDRKGKLLLLEFKAIK